MVTRPDPGLASLGPAAPDQIVIEIDGGLPLTEERVAELAAACDRAEQRGVRCGTAIVNVSGAPGGGWADGLSVALLSRWERTLRRLERLPAVTMAVAHGDCGGPALDALLATDYRIAATSMRLRVPAADFVTWPGMALYRLCRQAGAAAARKAALFGRPIGAIEALDMHLVDEVSDDTAAALAGAVRTLGAFAGAEMSIRRQLMLEATEVSFEDALGSHLAACDRELRRMVVEAAQ